MDEREHETVGHQLTINDREYTEITGVLHVESFDDEEIVLETELGLLALRGEELDIKELNLDEKVLSVEGLILEAAYSDESVGAKEKGKGKGFFSKLFK